MNRSSLSLLLAAGVLASCPKTTVELDAGVTTECATRADCPEGKVCTPAGACDFCATSGQCTVKEACQPDTLLCGLRAGWGTACTTNDTCQAGSWCKQGLCQERAQVSLCTGGLNAECPQGERCNQVTTVCEEDLGCSTDDDCSTAERCNPGSRACAPRCTVETQADRCAAAERCVDELCVQCLTSADCGPGLTCDAAGRCSDASRCYTDRDCSVPLVCLAQTGACLPKQPPCLSDDTCTADQRCDLASGRCVVRSCQPDRYEPNNDDTRAFNVAPGTYRSLTLCAADADWYAVTLARGDLLGVNLDADPFSEFTFSTVIKDTAGRTLAGGRLLVSYVAPVPARYFVVISTSDQFQQYDVTFLKSRGTPCDDDLNEPNDSASQPTLLNSTNQVDGRTCPQDQDWYRVSVPSGREVRASLINYDAAKGLMRLCLFSADGLTQLACSSELMPVVTAPPNLSASSVLVRVVGDTERVSNSYTLKVELL
jgi:hypothetical protein